MGGRFKDNNWLIPEKTDHTISWEGVHAALLMDIRDELKKLNTLLHCPNFSAIPHVLRDVAKNTKMTRKKRRPKKKV